MTRSTPASRKIRELFGGQFTKPLDVRTLRWVAKECRRWAKRLKQPNSAGHVADYDRISAGRLHGMALHIEREMRRWQKLPPALRKVR